MPMIQVRNLGRTFGKGEAATIALKSVSLDVKKGEFISIMGASGSGKSTLLHLLGLLDRPTTGEYLLADKDTTKLTETQRAKFRNKNIGFVFQSFHLLPRMTVVDNVAVPLMYSDVPVSQHKTKAKQALEQVGLGHRLEYQPNNLSGGEKQRVAIARALINNPNIILADEPTGNLDSKTGQQVMTLIQNLNQQGHTILVITHDQATASYGHRLVRLQDGLVIEERAL